MTRYETQEDINAMTEEEYDAWFRARVQESLDDPRPSVPHEQVMAEINERRSARRSNLK